MFFNQEFTIHPVGQGFFYSGLIRYKNETKFRMVFDCGSLTKNAGKDEVKLYRTPDFVTKKTIDLLVISHFDADHVNKIQPLLAGDIKVKRLVMPFLTFEERIFLVAKHLDANNGYNSRNTFVINFIIDPLGAIDNNLDGDSEVFFITNGPDKPIPGNKEILENKLDSSNEQKRYVFGFNDNCKESINSYELITKSNISRAYKVKDSNKGSLFVERTYKLMEFLFYKRSIGEKEELFFEKVKELFYKKYLINASLSGKELLTEIIAKVKEIRSGTQIKNIFKEAKKIVGFKGFQGLDLVDLNTTALCMLHRNLTGIFDFLNYPEREGEHLSALYYYDSVEIIQIQKFISRKSSRVETKHFYHLDYFWGNDYFNRKDRFVYPNALLTSDSFLLSSDQVDKFLIHYENYWGEFWLFQIPHHGSQENSDENLYANIPGHSNCFVNYGIGNRDSHPSANVISDLVATGKSTKLISVNQFSGLRFGLTL